MDFSNPPQPGDVIRYSYLWADEARQGREDGIKDRPVAVVVALQQGTFTRILALPITHTPPTGNTVAVEIPYQTGNRLGLDDSQSWIIVSEFNDFVWPGPDVRPVSQDSDEFCYGVLPRGLFQKVKNAMLDLYRSGQTEGTKRSD